MNQNYYNYRVPNTYGNVYENDDRFLFPFLLGGVAGAALAPAFYRRPVFYPPPVYPVGYPGMYPGFFPYGRCC